MATLKFVQAPTAAIALPMGDTDTSFYGLDIKDINGNYLSMTDFGTIGYMTINPTSPFAEIVSFTGCVYQGDGTTLFTGVTRGLLAIDPYTTGGTAYAHSPNDSLVFSINPQMLDAFVQKGQDATITGTFTFLYTKMPRASQTVTYGVGSDLWFATKEYVDGVAVAGAPNASTSTKGIGRVSVAPADANIPIFVGDNDDRVPVTDVSAVTADMYAAIVAASSPTALNPFLTQSSANSLIGQVIDYAGASLPTGYLLCDGSAVSRTTYSLLFTAIGTIWGTGDGSTTFNLPNLLGRTTIGDGAGSKVATFASRSSNVITVTGISNNSNNEFQTGEAVVFATSGTVIGGLTNGVTYYVVRTGNLTFSLATSLSNAIQGSVITLSSDGTGTRTFTKTFTTRVQGESGGEENHGLVIAEVPSHGHGVAGARMWFPSGGGPSSSFQAGNYSSEGSNAVANGGDTNHNTMMTFAVVKKIIKAL